MEDVIVVSDESEADSLIVMSEFEADSAVSVEGSPLKILLEAKYQ